EYIGAMRKAGFCDIKVQERAIYTHEQLSDYLKDTDMGGISNIAGMDLANLVASYKISAAKPKK
ncbi:MAG: hypothetical protein MUO81_03685, partial [Thermoplasmata archaeon]|nr:hypothetical protein [Thermoplasmata archaeon]